MYHSIQFKETFESAQWRKVEQRLHNVPHKYQVFCCVWHCGKGIINLLGRFVQDIFEEIRGQFDIWMISDDNFLWKDKCGWYLMKTFFEKTNVDDMFERTFYEKAKVDDNWWKLSWRRQMWRKSDENFLWEDNILWELSVRMQMWRKLIFAGKCYLEGWIRTYNF